MVMRAGKDRPCHRKQNIRVPSEPRRNDKEQYRNQRRKDPAGSIGGLSNHMPKKSKPGTGTKARASVTAMDEMLSGRLGLVGSRRQNEFAIRLSEVVAKNSSAHEKQLLGVGERMNFEQSTIARLD